MIITSSLLVEEPDLIDLIDKFMLRLPVLHEAIKTAHQNSNEEEFLGLIHQLKGVGGGYGYEIITQLCEKIEQQAAAKNDVSVLLEEFSVVVEKILCGKEANHKIVEKNA